VGTEKRERQRANRQLKHQQQVKVEQRRKTTRRGIIGAVVVAGGVALVVLIAAIGGAFSGDDGDETTPSTLPSELSTPDSVVAGETLPNGFVLGNGPCPPEDLSEAVKLFDEAPQLCIDPDAQYTATFVTSLGDIVVELDTENAPGTVNNFVTLARYGYYDDTTIFRTNTSIDIIQGGGRTNSDSPGYDIPDEGTGFTYQAGQLAMARTGAPNSAGGQWFFVVTDDGVETLDSAGTYVPFGTVTEGLEIAAEILALAGPDGDTPTEEIALETVTISEAGDATADGGAGSDSTATTAATETSTSTS
jgi:cyclophilin family peptidyl-prolyl cis-trans isomerase